MSTAGAVVPPAVAEQVQPGQTSRAVRPRLRRVLGAGALAVPTAVLATALAGALARGVGVDLEVPDGAQQIPLAGVAFVTGVFSTVGVVLALVLGRWSAHPATWFVRTTLALTALSFAPPLLVGAHPATAATLVGLHLVAASVMIPTLARSLRRGSRATPS